MACNRDCQDDILMIADSAAGAFTFITWSVALFQIGKHLKHYTNSYFQNKIISLFFLSISLTPPIAIIFMAPFYALTSFLTLYFQVTQPKILFSTNLLFQKGLKRIFCFSQRYL